MSHRRVSTRSSPAPPRVPSTPSTPTTPTHTTYESFSDLVNGNGSSSTSHIVTSPRRPGHRSGSFGAGGAAAAGVRADDPNSSPSRGFFGWRSIGSSQQSNPSPRASVARSNGVNGYGATSSPRRDYAAGLQIDPGAPPVDGDGHAQAEDDELDEEDDDDDDTQSRRVAQGIMGLAARRRESSGGGGKAKSSRPRGNSRLATHPGSSSAPPGNELNTLDLMKLTVGLAGAQLAWTIELAFGTPYLLSLGLTKRATSLVWLAGPLAGVIVQPLVGALSDASRSKYRRRAFIAGSAASVIVSTLFVAYARELGELLSAWSGLGDWDPKQEEKIKAIAITIGIVGFYVLDFSLNGLQASLRALILDQSPRHQQNIANAWHGRMTHFANIFGYGAGYIDLGHWSALSWVGGGQFRKLAVLSCTVMVLCVGATCWTQVERVDSDRRDKNESGQDRIQWTTVYSNVREAIRDLPLAVRRVCYLQFLQWMAWFPFLFYATSYVAEVFYASLPSDEDEPSTDDATRAGSLALLLYALVALTSGAFLPWLTTLGKRKFVDRRLSRSSGKGRLARHLLASLTPRNMWTLGSALYAIGMIATFWTSTLAGATTLIAFLGIPWAVTCWVPFALVMESIKEIEPSQPTASTSSTRPPNPSSPPLELQYDASPDPSPTKRPPPFRAAFSRQSSTQFHPQLQRQRVGDHLTSSECTPLLASSQPSDRGGEELEICSGSGSVGGTILGIHNLACCVPQFFVALIASLIFSILEKERSGAEEKDGEVSRIIVSILSGVASAGEGGGAGAGDESDGLRGSNDVVWVLRFGGLAALAGTFASRWLLETRTEREYKEEVLAWPREEDGDEDA